MKLRPFELALVIIFGGLALVALFLLSTADGKSSGKDGEQVVNVGQVTIWGMLPSAPINAILSELKDETDAYRGVTYEYIAPEDFNQRILTALADGEGPDIVLLSQELLVGMRKRIQPVSYDSYPIRDIRNQYLDGAQIFALNDGLYGYPIAVDPLMMYWNRDMLANESILEAPATWEVLVNDNFPKLIDRDFRRTVNQAVVAMGEYGNVENAFGVISTLLIQGGSQLVLETEDNQYVQQLRLSPRNSDPLEAAVDFYTRFSEPSNALYSWNRAFESDRLEFLSEDLALYFGYASEGPQLEKLNPNLNFDIAAVPQGEGASVRRTYGKFYALSTLRSSDNKYGASVMMLKLGGATLADRIAKENGMVSAFRSSVSAGSNDTYGRISYPSAATALGWLNPDLSIADGVFETMTQDVNENRRPLFEAVTDAVERLEGAY